MEVPSVSRAMAHETNADRVASVMVALGSVAVVDVVSTVVTMAVVVGSTTVSGAKVVESPVGDRGVLSWTSASFESPHARRGPRAKTARIRGRRVVRGTATLLENALAY
jgi:hypothetical protein